MYFSVSGREGKIIYKQTFGEKMHIFPPFGNFVFRLQPAHLSYLNFLWEKNITLHRCIGCISNLIYTPAQLFMMHDSVADALQFDLDPNTIL